MQGVALVKPIVFFTFALPSRSILLKLPVDIIGKLNDDRRPILSAGDCGLKTSVGPRLGF